MIDGLDMLVRSNGEPQQILARNRSILDVLESRGPRGARGVLQPQLSHDRHHGNLVSRALTR